MTPKVMGVVKIPMNHRRPLPHVQPFSTALCTIMEIDMKYATTKQAKITQAMIVMIMAAPS